MLEKKIKATKDFSISTKVDNRYILKGDVVVVKFCSEDEFKGHLKSGFFEETTENVGQADIPVLLPPTTVPTVKVTEGPYIDQPIDADLSNTVVGGVKEEVNDLSLLEESDNDVVPKDDGTVDIISDDDDDDDDKEAVLNRENAKGKPYKCLNPECDRLRKKTELYCAVCLKSKGN